MKISTTDGREHILVMTCPYCHTDTGGRHQRACQNYMVGVTRVVSFEEPSPLPRPIKTLVNIDLTAMVR